MNLRKAKPYANLSPQSGQVSVSVKQGDFFKQKGAKHLKVCITGISETNEDISEEIAVNVSKENYNIKISCNVKES